MVTYEYTAYGVQHRGQCFLRYWSPMVGMFDVGSSFPVYFATDEPEVSFAPNAPRTIPLIICGLVIGASGGAILFFGWTR